MENANQNEEAKIFAENLSYYMKLHKVDRVMLANELGFKYTTVCDWCNGKVVPRKNKIKVLANYFSISESDLTWRDNLLTDKNINKKIICKIHNKSLAEYDLILFIIVYKLI